MMKKLISMVVKYAKMFVIERKTPEVNSSFTIPCELSIPFTKSFRGMIDELGFKFTKSDGSTYFPDTKNISLFIIDFKDAESADVWFAFDNQTHHLYTKSTHSRGHNFIEADNFYYAVYNTYSSMWKNMLSL
jgi:hypothetical protein